MGWMLAAHRQCPRRLCRDRAPPGARVASWRSSRSSARAAAIYALSARDADRLSAGGGPGRVLRLRAVAGRRVGRRAPARRCGGSRRCCRSMPQVENVFVDRRLLDHRRRQRAECGVHRADAEAVRRPRRRRQFGAGADRAGVRRGPADPHRDGHPVQPAADHRACRPPAGSNTSSRASRARNRRR